jgi:hypothetical protein
LKATTSGLPIQLQLARSEIDLNKGKTPGKGTRGKKKGRGNEVQTKDHT